MKMILNGKKIRALCVLLLVFIVGFLFFLLNSSNGMYNINISEEFDLATVNNKSDILWKTKDSNIQIMDDKVLALKAGVAHVMGVDNGKTVENVTINVLDGNESMTLDFHSVKMKLNQKSKIVVRKKGNNKSDNIFSIFLKKINRFFKIGFKGNDKALKTKHKKNKTISEKTFDKSFSNNNSYDDVEEFDENGIVDDDSDTSSSDVDVDDKDEVSSDNLVLDKNDIFNDASYISTDTKVATVNDEGVINPVSEGNTTIMVVDDEGNVDYAHVVVSEGIILDKTSYDIDVDDKVQIEYDLSNSDYSDEDVRFISLDSSIATVTNEGIVTGIRSGKCIIKVRVGNSFEKEVEITVKDNVIWARDLKLSMYDLNLNIGDSIDVDYEVLPEDTFDKNVVWYSNNDEVATVSNGIINAVGVGSTKIDVVTANGIKKSINVLVKEKDIEVTDIDFTNLNVDMNVEEIFKINYKVIPSDATNQDVYFVYDDDYVEINDLYVRAIKAGKTVIKGISSNGISRDINVNIEEGENVNSILVDDKLNLKVGTSNTLNVEFLPNNAVDKGVSYSSSNVKVAKVDDKGNVTGVGVGSAVITVTLDSNKNVQAKSVITVSSNVIDVSSIKLDRSSLDLKIGKSYKLLSEVSPSNAANKNVSYSSNNVKVAKVDNKGNITGVGVGSAVITVTSNNNKNIQAKCLVNVSSNLFY